VFSTTFCTRCLHPPNCTDHFSVLQILSVLRTALTIELSLGCVLLYYILKCICALKGKGKNHNKKTRKLKKTASHQNVSTFLSETFTSSPGSAYPFFFYPFHLQTFGEFILPMFFCNVKRRAPHRQMMLDICLHLLPCSPQVETDPVYGRGKECV
jgi:hypothetical protein